MGCAAQPCWGGWLGPGEQQRARAGGVRRLDSNSRRGISSKRSKGRERDSSRNRDRGTGSRGNRGKTTDGEGRTASVPLVRAVVWRALWVGSERRRQPRSGHSPRRRKVRA